MLITNARLANRQDLVDIQITNGKFTAIAANLAAKPGEKVIDANQKLVLPPFVDSHVHLDTTLTAGQPEYNESGTLFDGIRIWAKRKQSLTKQDVKQRAKKALSMMAKNGIQYVRSHVDVTDPNLTAVQALLEVKEEVKDFTTLQLVAFPQDGVLAFPNGMELLSQALKEGCDVVGGIPHYELTCEDGWQSVHQLVALAEKYDKLVDMHCDEIDDPASRNLEVLAADAYRSGLLSRVTASHTTAFGSYNDAYAYKLMRLLKLSQINFIANPLVNVHLGGRFDTYPKRRGLTRVKELTAANINVAFGEDDLADPWNPLGTANMLDVVFMGNYITQMMGYSQLNESYRFVTTNAAKALNLTDYGIKVGNSANCIILDAKDFVEALNHHSVVLTSIRNGQQIVTTTPATTKMTF